MFHAKAKAVVYTGLVLLQFEMFSNILLTLHHSGQARQGGIFVAGPVSQAVMLAQSEGLENTHWTLVELNGQPVEAGSTDKEAYFELDPKGKTLQGLTGCNRMSGGYETRGDALQFSKVVMTRMACVKGMEIEAAFSKALNSDNEVQAEWIGAGVVGCRGVACAVQGRSEVKSSLSLRSFFASLRLCARCLPLCGGLTETRSSRKDAKDAKKDRKKKRKPFICL